MECQSGKINKNIFQDFKISAFEKYIEFEQKNIRFSKNVLGF